MKGALFSKKELEAKNLQLWGAVLSLVFYAAYMAARLIQYGETVSYYSDGWYAYLTIDLVWGLPNIVLIVAVLINDKLKGRAREILMTLTGLEAFITGVCAFGVGSRSLYAFVETGIMYNPRDLWFFIFLVEIILFILIPGINKLLLQISLLGVTGIYAAAFVLDVMLAVVRERPIESSARWIELAALTAYQFTLYFFACEISAEKPTVYSKLYKKIKRWIRVYVLEDDSADVYEADILTTESEDVALPENVNIRRSMADIDFYDDGEKYVIDEILEDEKLKETNADLNRSLFVSVEDKVSDAMCKKEKEAVIYTAGDPDLGDEGGKLTFRFEYSGNAINASVTYSFEINGSDVEYYKNAAKEISSENDEYACIVASVKKSADGGRREFCLHSKYPIGDPYGVHNSVIKDIHYYLILVIMKVKDWRR